MNKEMENVESDLTSVSGQRFAVLSARLPATPDSVHFHTTPSHGSWARMCLYTCI